jgi:hypothetical protein
LPLRIRIAQQACIRFHSRAARMSCPARAPQTALDPLQQAAFCGCHLVRDPNPALAAAGFASVDAARFSLGDAAALAAARDAPGGGAATVAALRAASADGGAGWAPRLGGAPPPPHFLLSPHVAGIATA